MGDILLPDSHNTSVVVTCKEDKSSCIEALNTGVLTVSAEFILTGILQHKIVLNKYSLY